MARKPRVDPASSAHSDSGGSEDETTRCVCGNEELEQGARTRGANPGLFVQCETCHVWQHGFCVGFTREKNVPDTYFCERCRPDFHEILDGDGFTRSRYQPLEQTPEEAQGVSQNGASLLESSEQEKSEDPDEGSRDSTVEKSNDQSVVQRKAKPHKRRSLPAPLEELPERTSRAGRKRRSREDEILQRVLEESAREAREREAATGPEKKGIDHSEYSREIGDSRSEKEDGSKWQKASVPGRERDESHGNGKKTLEPDEAAIEEHEPQLEQPKRRRRGRKRANDDQNTKKQNGHGPIQNGTAGGAKKCKPRLPSPRSSFPEMRRRVASIIEFSSRIQAEITVSTNARDAAIATIRSDLPDLVGKVENLASQSEANLSALEALTRKLLSWQEEFGV